MASEPHLLREGTDRLLTRGASRVHLSRCFILGARGGGTPVPESLPTKPRRRFENAVAVVTGGSKGIGLAIASRLASEGACVTINARPSAELERALRQLENEGADALAVPGDITQPGVVEGIVAA